MDQLIEYCMRELGMQSAVYYYRPEDAHCDLIGVAAQDRVSNITVREYSPITTSTALSC
jgi:hypothetical protein